MCRRSRDCFYGGAAAGAGQENRTGMTGTGGWATAAAAARPGSQNSHDDFSQWHLCWLCDTVA